VPLVKFCKPELRGELQLHSAERGERAHEMALQVIDAVSSHAKAGRSLEDFCRRLAGTVAGLVSAQQVLFWRLRDDHMLVPVAGHAIPRSLLARLTPARSNPDGDDLASKVVHHDLIFRASRGDAPAPYAYVLDTLGVDSALSVPWRAGDLRLGLVAAYESTRPGGFSWEDTWTLQQAGLAAGLVTQVWMTQEDLDKTVDRLTKVDAARQLLLKNMTAVVERERARIVTELHDDALQKLTAAELQVARLGPDAPADAQTLSAVRDLLEQTERALRRLVFDVRPPALESPDGLAQSIRDRLAMLSGGGIWHELDIDLPGDLTADDRSMIFREVAEAIGNVERHAKATQVKVSLKTSDGGVLGVIQDNGQGFNVAERSNLPGHLGLLALRERALMAGGRYKIESKPGSGTRIEFWIPIQR
jgi:signal transduction histidine kinase